MKKNALLISAEGSLLVGCVAMGFAAASSAAISLDGLFNITYFIISLFTMKVASLVVQGDDEHFPIGYSFFEPLINGIQLLFQSQGCLGEPLKNADPRRSIKRPN